MGRYKYGFIVAQPAQCRECGTPIIILESEATSIYLNAMGYPIGYNQEFYSCRAKCPECGKEFEVEKEGLQYKIIDK